MVMQKKIKKTKRVAKKSFYTVEASLTAVPITLYGTGPEVFDGNVVTLDLTKSLRGKAMELRLKVVHKDGKLTSVPQSTLLSGSFIRRSIRRGTDYIETSLNLNSKDKNIVVKPFLITRKRVSRPVRNALRQAIEKFLREYIGNRTTDDIFSEILANKIQRAMATKLKKIYPLAFSEIRVFEVKGERNEKLEEIKPVKKAEKEETKKEEKKPAKKETKKAESKGEDVKEIKKEEVKVEEKKEEKIDTDKKEETKEESEKEENK